MMQLEIIHVRLVREQSDWLIEDIRRSAVATRGTVRIYRRVAMGGDIAVHLLVEAPHGDVQPSELGVQLARALRNHGMVEHSIWLESIGDEPRP